MVSSYQILTFFFIASGVGLSPCTAATSGLLYQPQMIGEAMAQTSCVMFLSKDGMKNCYAYFMSIDNVKFRKPVKPGDYLEIKVEVVKGGARRGKVKGQAFADGVLTTEAEFAFVIVDKNGN